MKILTLIVIIYLNIFMHNCLAEEDTLPSQIGMEIGSGTYDLIDTLFFLRIGFSENFLLELSSRSSFFNTLSNKSLSGGEIFGNYTTRNHNFSFLVSRTKSLSLRQFTFLLGYDHDLISLIIPQKTTMLGGTVFSTNYFDMLTYKQFNQRGLSLKWFQDLTRRWNVGFEYIHYLLTSRARRVISNSLFFSQGDLNSPFTSDFLEFELDISLNLKLNISHEFGFSIRYQQMDENTLQSVIYSAVWSYFLNESWEIKLYTSQSDFENIEDIFLIGTGFSYTF